MTIDRLKRFVKDRHVLAAYGVGAVIGVSSLYFLWPFFIHQGNVVVHYGSDGVVDVLTGPLSLVTAAVIGALTFLIDILFSYFLYWRERVLSYMIMYATLWFVILFALFVWQLTRFN
ncbi:MAG: hypothetical protein WC246_02680 [Candidatus Paceibacterota bacterium]|jgi:hypothetical protein